MNLLDLIKNLYSKKNRESGEFGGATKEDRYDFSQSLPGEKEDIFEEEILKEQEKKDALSSEEFVAKKKKVIVFGSIAFLAVIILSSFGFWLVYQYKKSSFNEDKVIVEVKGEGVIESGKVVGYEFVVKNENRVDLSDVELSVSYPSRLQAQEKEGALPQGNNSFKVTLGSLKKGKSASFSAEFFVSGKGTDKIFLDATVNYRPDNFSSNFKSTSQKAIDVNPSLLKMNLVSQKEVVSGEKMEIKVILENTDEKDYENLILEPFFPEEFSLKGSEEGSLGANYPWKIGSIKTDERKEFIIRGVLNGNSGDAMKFIFQLREQSNGDDRRIISERETISSIIAGRVNAQHFLKKENFSAGERVENIVVIKNVSQMALRGVIIKSFILEGADLVEEGAIDTKGGYYDSKEKSITWRASDFAVLSYLSPGQEAQVEFSFNVKNILPVEKGKENLAIKVQSSVESLDVDTPLGGNKTIFSNQKGLKINSKLIVDQKIYYRDGVFAGEGPTPPKTGEETVLSMEVELKNTNNLLKDVIFETELPSGVNWKNEFSPENLAVTFNERTNKLSWKIDVMKPGAGFYEPVVKFAFKIGIVPSVVQVGEPITVLKNSNIKAKDSFTGEEITYSFDEFLVRETADAEKIELKVVE